MRRELLVVTEEREILQDGASFFAKAGGTPRPRGGGIERVEGDRRARRVGRAGRVQPQDHSVLLQAEQAVARVLAQASRQQRAYRRVLETIGVTLDWELGAVWEISDDAMLRCAVRWRTDGVDGEGLENAMRGLVLARGQDLPGRVWKTGRPAATQCRCSYARRLSHKCPAMRIASERWEARC